MGIDMTNWKHKIKIKHLFTEEEDWESVQTSMTQIGNILERELCFRQFDVGRFKKIPQGDDVIGPVDYANKLLAKMYDYADDNLIWIE